jgi:hypothetical protein
VSDFWPAGMTLRAVIPWSSFRDAPLYWLLRGLREVGVAAKTLARYTYDNHHQVIAFSPWPVEFEFSVSHNNQQAYGSPLDKEYRAKFGKDYTGQNVYGFKVWGRSGSQLVWENNAFLAKDGTVTIPAAVLDSAHAAMEAYCKGELACSDCGALLPLKELPGHYFAGTYCAPCWLGERGKNKGRGGWKAVEARETYD